MNGYLSHLARFPDGVHPDPEDDKERLRGEVPPGSEEPGNRLGESGERVGVIAGADAVAPRSGEIVLAWHLSQAVVSGEAPPGGKHPIQYIVNCDGSDKPARSRR